LPALLALLALSEVEGSEVEGSGAEGSEVEGERTRRQTSGAISLDNADGCSVSCPHVTQHRLGLRLLACVLLAAMLCAAGVVKAHNHLGGGFRHDCPACQHERTVGTSSEAVSVATGETAPALVGLVYDYIAIGVLPDVTVRQSSPRGPPSSLPL